MENKHLEKLKIEINNLMQYRNTCLNFLALLASGILGLVVVSFSIFKLCLIILGLIGFYFLAVMIYVLDVDIDNKIKDVEK